MKVGTDGVLLGAWAQPLGEAATSALDVGTGTGLIALMLAQRFPDLLIDAIDIDSNAAEQAAENFSACPWSSRLAARQADFLEFAAACDKKYDLIVSNPPFFADSLKCPDEARSAARHDNGLPLAGLILKSADLLAENGNLCIIAPADRATEIESLCDTNSLYINHKTSVISIEGAAPKRILYSITKSATTRVTTTVTIATADHAPTLDYTNLVGQYYLRIKV